jgi:hypothetical protein
MPARMIVWIAVAALAAAVAGVAVALQNDRVAPPRPVANHAFTGIPDRARPIVVWAVGDGAADTPGAKRVGRMIAADHPDRVLYLGDVYESGTPAEFKAGMTGVFGPLLHRILPTPGNHEWPAHLTGYDPYWRALTGAPTPPWYAVTVGRWQVLSLNSEAPHGPTTPQVRWLRARITEPFGTCRIGFWHRPRYSAGLHGDQPDIKPLWVALAGHAALVLNGHDHDVQRLKPIRGTTEIVTGAGGRSHYEVEADDERLAYSNDTADAALRIELHGTEAQLKVVATSGRTLDTDTVTCR